MTRLWLVRHGPTHARRLVGHVDLPADLSDTARLRRLSDALPDAAVVSSDLRRAAATADAIAYGRPRLPSEAGLREFDYGDWDDRPFDEIDCPELRAYLDDPGARRAPGGESWDDVDARVEATLARLTAAAPADLIVVAHMGVILTRWARATGLAPFRALAQGIAPLSLTRIDLAPGGPIPVFADRHP